MTNEKAIVPLNLEPPTVHEQEPTEMVQVQARTISKFAEASMIEYTDHELQILFAPIDPKDIKVRPDGQIYCEWAWYSERLDQAFGQGQWSLSPAPWNPRLCVQGNITYREYVLWIRGQFVGNAVGHHEEQRKTANFGDAAEATYANALVRCCKHLGMARDLWKKDKIEEFKRLMKTKGGAAGSNVHSPIKDEQPTVGSPPPLDYFVHCKDQLSHAGNIDELKILWKFAVKHRDQMSEAQFTELEAMKNKRKSEMTVEV